VSIHRICIRTVRKSPEMLYTEMCPSASESVHRSCRKWYWRRRRYNRVGCAQWYQSGSQALDPVLDGAESWRGCNHTDAAGRGRRTDQRRLDGLTDWLRVKYRRQSCLLRIAAAKLDRHGAIAFRDVDVNLQTRTASIQAPAWAWFTLYVGLWQSRKRLKPGP